MTAAASAVPLACHKCKLEPTIEPDYDRVTVVCGNCFDADMVGDPPHYISRSIVGEGHTREAAIEDWNERTEEATT